MESIYFFVCKLRQNLVAVFQSGNDLIRSVFPLIGDCTPIPDQFIQNNEGLSKPMTWLHSTKIVSNVHDCIFYPFFITRLLVKVTKEVRFPLFSIYSVLPFFFPSDLKAISIPRIFDEV